MNFKRSGNFVFLGLLVLAGCGDGADDFQGEFNTDAAAQYLSEADDALGVDEDIFEEDQSPYANRVEIYLTAGDTTASSACNKLNSTNCDIYKLRIDLSSKRVSNASVIANSSHGEIFPALSPNGEYLAYERRSNGSGAGDIVVQNVSSVTANVITGLLTAPQSGRFPHWRSNENLLFDRRADSDPDANVFYAEPYATNDRWTNIFVAPITTDGLGNPELDPLALLRTGTTAMSGLRSALPIYLGDTYQIQAAGLGSTATLDTEEYAFHDTFTNPSNRYEVAGHAVHASNCDSSGACDGGVPFVVDFSPKKSVSRMKSFNLNLGNGHHLVSCAHVAFRQDGEKVICTEQHSSFNRTTHAGTSIIVKQDILYRFSFNASSGEYEIDSGVAAPGMFYDRALFKQYGPAELQRLNGNFSTPGEPNDDGDYCAAIVHKSAEYCGDQDNVLLRVHCLGTGGDMLFSRMYLVDLSDKAAPVYTDLTAEIESWFGKTANSMHGQSGTCSSL